MKPIERGRRCGDRRLFTVRVGHTFKGQARLTPKDLRLIKRR